MPGFAQQLLLNGSGMHLSGLDAATTLDPYKAAALRGYFDLANSAGNVLMTLNKSASVKYSGIYGQMNGAYRWIMYLGDNHAETGSNNGSDFYLYACSDTGTTSVAMSIDRASKIVTMPGGINVGGSDFIVDANGICTAVDFQATNGVYGGSGTTLYLRPVGYSSATGQATINSAGDMNIGRYMNANGYLERAGTAAGDGSQYFNFDYVGGAGPLHAWINGADLGAVAFTCDYRLKKDVQPLGSTWDKVKALSPWASAAATGSFTRARASAARRGCRGTATRSNGALSRTNFRRRCCRARRTVTRTRRTSCRAPTFPPSSRR